MIDEFQVDMHQRDQETVVPGLIPNTTKTRRRKPFYAAELVLKGLDLRAILATFSEPLKRSVQVTPPPEISNYRTHEDLPNDRSWFDSDDFNEVDWKTTSLDELHLLPVVSCPRIMYFKRNSMVLNTNNDKSKFGDEQTHRCLLGKEPCL
jgi:hypothetical protein